MINKFLFTTTLLCSLFVFFAVGVRPTFAQMMDSEDTTENTVKSGSLDFSIVSDPSEISIFSASDSASIVTIQQEGNLGFQYQSKYQFDSGDESFCQDLHLQVKSIDESKTFFDDNLSLFTEFSESQQFFPILNTHALKYLYSFEESMTIPTEPKSCQFLVITDAWQLDQLTNSLGYSDTEKTPITLTFDPNLQQEIPPVDNGKVVINEVYEDGTNTLEWVELYNNNSQGISLNDWKIADKAGSDVLPNSSISGKSFAVIVTSGADSSLVSQLNALGILVIQLDNSTIGSGLNVGGDELYLKDELDQVVDALSWGSEKAIFNMPNLADGDSYSRVSTGVDTDSEIDWERLQTPGPGS